MQLDDSQISLLIVDASNGDADALQRLLLHFYEPVLAHIDRQLGGALRSHADPEDVLQETFADVFRGMDAFEGTSAAAFTSWVNKIASHRIYDLGRSAGRQKRGGAFRRVEVGQTESTLQALVAEIAGSDATPSRVVAKEEAILAMQVAIAGLKDRYRQVIQLKYIEGHTNQQIAETMGESLAAIRGLLDRARAALRKSFDDASRYLSS